MDRIALTIKFGRPDRIPVIPQIFGHSARLCNIPLRDYCLNGDTLANCQLRALKYYQYDAVFAVADTSVEAEAVGVKLEYADNQYPFITSNLFHTTTNLSSVKVPNPQQDGRMPQLLKAIRAMRSEVGNETLVVGLVLGPLTLAAQLMGLEPVLYAAVDNPGDFEQLLDFCVKVQKTYGQAQLDAGAHLVMVFDPCAGPEIVPHQFFRELELPRVTEMFRLFKEQGTAASWLHIAGQTKSILPYYPLAGVDIANFDYPVEPAVIHQLLPQVCVDGNIRSLAFIEDEPENIDDLACKLVSAFAARGGYILSSGCEIPPEAKPDNIKALVEAAKGIKGA